MGEDRVTAGVRPPVPHARAAVVALALAGTLSACASAAVGSPGGPSPSHPSTTTRATLPTTTTTVPPTTTTATVQAGWSLVSMVGGRVAVDQRAVTGPNGGTVNVVRFHAGVVRYALHVGSGDPPTGGATVTPDAGPTIGPDESPFLLAAFNGGFKMSAGAGGFELDGQILQPLVPGVTSLVIDSNGSAHVGVWEQGLPAVGEAVASVRQNLPPLVSGGVASPTVGDVGAWGSTLGGGASVARSGLGEDANGNLIFAGGMSLVPADLASGLVQAGAVTAMELDINPEWVQADAAPAPGQPLAAAVTGQNRPANQFELGWTRDFVTVLAAH